MRTQKYDRKYIPISENLVSSRILENLPTLPCQYIEPKHIETPEKKLMLKVFTNAIESLYKYSKSNDPAKKKKFREDRTWINSDDKNSLYSFLNLCEMLEIDPGYIRGELNNDGFRFSKNYRYHSNGDRTRVLLNRVKPKIKKLRD
tara:strand:+ start:147 stop:584 length:438 start_codon:yes stop_codon:yes gene_type:complete